MPTLSWKLVFKRVLLGFKFSVKNKPFDDPIYLNFFFNFYYMPFFIYAVFVLLRRAAVTDYTINSIEACLNISRIIAIAKHV